MNNTDVWTLATIVCLAAVTVVTRSFFFISSKPWTLPAWVRRGLNYAPIAALAAVIVPEIVMSQGHLINTWLDARLFSVAAGAGWFYWRRDVFGVIVVGMTVYLALHLGMNW